MARKVSITRNVIMDVAFALAKEEGVGAVSARKLAARASCSTQPIFRIFKNMDELTEELFTMAAAYFEGFYQAYPASSDTPFVNMGMAYIRFAVENKHVFAMLFVADKRYGKTLYDLLSGETGAVGRELAKAKAAGAQDATGLFAKMWMVIHGAACMSLTGDFDLGEAETLTLLEETYKAFT